MPAACKPTQRDKNELINVGIDVGKRFCPPALKAEDRRLLDELRFENTSQGVHELLTHIAAHDEAGGMPYVIAYGMANHKHAARVNQLAFVYVSGEK